MRSAQDFYRRRHQDDADYSGGLYNLPQLFRQPEFRRWAKDLRDGSKLLDVGIGKGLFLGQVLDELRTRGTAEPAEIHGIDLVRSPGASFDRLGPSFELLLQDLDGQQLPYSDDAFDFVSCNHVLEHIFETEGLVRELRRVLKPKGLCVISVPNLASWVNRISFFFWGNQPLGSELGTESVTYGFRPRFLQRRLESFHPSGHIRDFTPRGLHDLCQLCGLESSGWWPQSFGLVAALHPWAGRNLGILCSKTRPETMPL